LGGQKTGFWSREGETEALGKKFYYLGRVCTGQAGIVVKDQRKRKGGNNQTVACGILGEKGGGESRPFPGGGLLRECRKAPTMGKVLVVKKTGEVAKFKRVVWDGVSKVITEGNWEGKPLSPERKKKKKRTLGKGSWR